MIRLITHSKCPPGQFYYLQSEGAAHRFASTPEINTLAQVVSNFRSANHLPRTSYAEALEDIDAFTCARLGNDPRWCYQTQIPFDQTAPSILANQARPCATCGAKV